MERSIRGVAAQRALDEPGRLAALRRYAVLDTGVEHGLERIIELVCLTLDVPVAAVSLIDDRRQWFKYVRGVNACATAREHSFCARVLGGNRPFHVPDARGDGRFSRNPLVAGPPYVRSYLGVPLMAPDGYILGALCAKDRDVRRFQPGQIAILQKLGELVMNELELRLIASTDELTGLASRRAFLVEATRALAQFRRHGRPACLAILDIDHFKSVNDTHGHAVGDSVLEALAEIARRNVREVDIVGRLGGEEFAILMPDTTEAAAGACVGRLREVIATVPVRTPDAALQVTASFGLAPLTANLPDVEAWLDAADMALYRAKRAGRNCCMAAAA